MGKTSSLVFITVCCLLMLLVQCSPRETNDHLVSGPDPRNGQVLRIPGLDLRQPGAMWAGSQKAGNGEDGKKTDSNTSFVYQEGADGTGYYKIDRSNTSLYTMPLVPNRSYILSVLFNADFKRDSSGRTREINIGLRTYDGGGKNIVDNLNGLPMNKTNGWERWEWEFTTDQRAMSGRLHINLYEFSQSDILKIADIAFIEIPPKPLKPFNKGDGVTFRGGPGNLPMKVERAEAIANTIEVQTSGALYIFDLSANTITASQLLEKKRPVSFWQLSSVLKGLEILVKNDKECALANDHITFGVQCDGLVMVSPQEELVLDCESKIGGKWNRLAAGHLFCRDEWGGFSVNPDIPLGTGRLARVDANVRTGRVMGGELDFSGIADNKTFISTAEPGWKIKWNMSPGERIGISVFPPRPYPWKESFNSAFALAERSFPIERYKELAKFSNHILLWDFIQRGWGNSYTTHFELVDEQKFKDHIAAVKESRMTACPYMSPYFFYSRDPETFTSEVKRYRDKYGIDGVYFDGIPSQEWIVAYEEMRMTREILKEGTIIFHNTGHASNGTPPLGEVSLKIPAVETYADITYGGELVWGVCSDWAYPEYMESQYGMANNIGTMIMGEENTGWMGIETYKRELIMLKYNGRIGQLPLTKEGMEKLGNYYFPVLNKLKNLWEEKGNDPEFYEKYYLPEYKQLTGK